MATTPVRSADLSVIAAIVLLMTCAVFMPACGAQLSNPGPARGLTKDSVTLAREHGFTAIAVWSLRIEDQTGKLKGMQPKFSIGPFGAAENLREYLATGQARKMAGAAYMSSYSTVTPFDGTWTDKNGKAVYDGLFVVELRPGEREFFQVRLESRDEYKTPWVERRVEQWVSVPLDAPCRVAANMVYDLGLLDIVITERIVTDPGKVSFGYSIQTPPMNIPNTEKLTQQYPAFAFPLDSVVRECAFSVRDSDSQ
ncbi:MAG: hypothetical protein V1736_11040 [Pseudomonadota bacterium]